MSKTLLALWVILFAELAYLNGFTPISTLSEAATGQLVLAK